MGGHTGGCMIPTERARPNEPARGHTHVRTRTHARTNALRMRSACAPRARYARATPRNTASMEGQACSRRATMGEGLHLAAHGSRRPAVGDKSFKKC